MTTRKYLDVNQDGSADLLVSDVNQNGHIESDEVLNVTQNNIPMPTESDISDQGIDPCCDTGTDLPDYSSNNDITLVDF